MLGRIKSPLHFNPKKSLDITNPFDSDDETDYKNTPNPARRTSSAPTKITQNLNTNPFDDNDTQQNESVQELENYVVHKSEETSKRVNSCLKIAEDIRESASKTLVTLHHQGEQITRSHTVAAEIDHDLTRGEKLLGSLGGIFSKTWRPKKIRSITGPIFSGDNPSQRKVNHVEQREKLGLISAPKERLNLRTAHSEPALGLQKVEVEKAKQDDALSDLSNILGELKNMAIDMGSEMNRQNKGLDYFCDYLDELNYRVKCANQPGRLGMPLKALKALLTATPPSGWVF